MLHAYTVGTRQVQLVPRFFLLEQIPSTRDVVRHALGGRYLLLPASVRR